MNDPTISVLIPAYNRAGTIARCLRSALDSGYGPLQVVVADNGSSDGTLVEARRAAAGDPRVSFIAHAANLGPIANWRSCLAEATGDLVHWLWSDDWVDPQFYRAVVDAMAGVGAEVGICAARLVDPAGICLRVVHVLPRVPREELLAGAIRGGEEFPVSPLTALLPRASVLRHFTAAIPPMSGLDCNRRAIGCDALMLIGAVSDAARVAVLPEPLVNMAVHEGSITTGSPPRLINSHYAHARRWWGACNGHSWKAGVRDRLRLLRDCRFVAALACHRPPDESQFHAL